MRRILRSGIGEILRLSGSWLGSLINIRKKLLRHNAVVAFISDIRCQTVPGGVSVSSRVTLQKKMEITF